MAVFKVETKNKVDIDKKPRVYFTCHSDDFEKYFKKICNDIFKTHDCAIYYTEDMTKVIAEDEKQVDLGRNNLFVVPVTFKLLTTPNRAMYEDIPYALKEHIPVLPIMMESGIDEFYSSPDKFGELQYLNPYSTDLTEISYEEKLKKYLESVLISDELAKRVRAAFDAYIFLSYRKKDRKYANELMRLIHSNPECRDIAIWFDEFLTPGESFKENIEKILDDCKLFTLLVTPQLLEKVVYENGEERDNYVISTELPLARKNKKEKGTDIFAVEMEDTDKESLSSIDIEDYVNYKDEAFRSRLLEAISKIAISENNTPEHNFLIGLAYLDGIDVEINRESAIKLITSAAEAELPEAMGKIYDIYRLGNTRSDYHKAKEWCKKNVVFYSKELGEENPTTLTWLNYLADVLCCLGEYEEAIKVIENAYITACRVLGEENPDTLMFLSNLSVIYNYHGDYDKAFLGQEKIYELCKKNLGEEHPDTLSALCNLANECSNINNSISAYKLRSQTYKARQKKYGEKPPANYIFPSDLMEICYNGGGYAKALEFSELAYYLSCKALGEEYPTTVLALKVLASAWGNIKDYKKALKLSQKAYQLTCKIYGEEHPNTVMALNDLAIAYGDTKNYEKELETAQKAYDICYQTLGEEHPKTLIMLNNLSCVYEHLKDYSKMIETIEKEYAISKKIFGKTHSKTLVHADSLAYYYRKSHNYEKEADIYRQQYEYFSKIQSEDVSRYYKRKMKAAQIKAKISKLMKCK